MAKTARGQERAMLRGLLRGLDPAEIEAKIAAGEVTPRQVKLFESDERAVERKRQQRAEVRAVRPAPTKGPRTERGKRRAELRDLLRGKSLRQLMTLLDSGVVTERDLRTFYQDERAVAQKRIVRVAASDVPYADGEPNFLPSSALTSEDLPKELADLNRFVAGKSGVESMGIAGRRAVRKETIATLQDRQFDVNDSNFDLFWRFQNWLAASGRLAKYDSDSDEIEIAFDELQDLVAEYGISTSEESLELYDLFELVMEDV